MSDPHDATKCGPAGAPLSEPEVYGEPNGPQPPRINKVDKPARQIRLGSDDQPRSGYADSAGPRRTEVGRDGFFGGVENSRELRGDD